MSNASSSIKFRWGLSASDPEEQPVLIVGRTSHLGALTWNDVKCKLEPRVTEEAWRRGVSCATRSPGDTVELWPQAASLASLPVRCSRHAAPSRCHALAKILRGLSRQGNQTIVLACNKSDVYASAAAIARSFPLYTARSGVGPLGAPAQQAPASGTVTITVEVILMEPDQVWESEEDDASSLEPILRDTTLTTEDLNTLQSLADGVRLAAKITDTPANVCDVDYIIQEACKVAKELDIPEPTIIRGEELLSRGMGGLYGVGKAAARPPALVALSYDPPGAPETPVTAWVGKGIVYDTGGLSIKARTSMVGMKGDCGGAAAVLGAFSVMVRAKPTTKVHAVLCLAENAVGPLATRPDDVHQLYSGRTVEINNTDAEGRLVLADGVVYAARDLHATTVVDVATLTGAQGTATGKYHAAVVCNEGPLERACVRAGLRSGDLAHALPFAPELHFCEFTSVVADMKNSVADRGNAQPSCAGLFVLAHLGFDFAGRWLHVDMAAPAHCGERATGYGVALLPLLFGMQTRSPLLRALAPQC